MYILKALLISLVTGSFQVLGSTTTTGYTYEVAGIQSKFCSLPILSSFETSVRDQLCTQLCSQLASDFTAGKIHQTKIESIIQPYGLKFDTIKPLIVQVAQEVKVPVNNLKFITASEIYPIIFGDLSKKEEFTTYDAYTEFKNVEKLISLTALKKSLSEYERSILTEYLTKSIYYKSINTGDILRLCEANLIKIDSIQTGLLMLLKEIKQLIKDVEIDMTGYYSYIVNLPEVRALLVTLEPTIKGGNISQEKMMLAFSLYLNAKADAAASGKDLSKFELDFKSLATMLSLDPNSAHVNQMFAQFAPIEKVVIKAVPSAAIARIVKISGSSVVSITDSETLQQNQYRYYLNTYLGQHDKYTPKIISTIFDQLKSTYSACKICQSVNSSLKQEAAIYVAADFKTDTIRSLLDTSATLKFSSNGQFTEIKKKKAEEDKKKKEEEKKKAEEKKKKEKEAADKKKKEKEAADKKKKEKEAEDKKKKEAEDKKKKEDEDKKKKEDEDKKKKEDEDKKKKEDEDKKKKEDEDKKKKEDEDKKKEDEDKKKDNEDKNKKDNEDKKKKDEEEEAKEKDPVNINNPNATNSTEPATTKSTTDNDNNTVEINKKTSAAKPDETKPADLTATTADPKEKETLKSTGAENQTNAPTTSVKKSESDETVTTTSKAGSSDADKNLENQNQVETVGNKAGDGSAANQKNDEKLATVGATSAGEIDSSDPDKGTTVVEGGDRQGKKSTDSVETEEVASQEIKPEVDNAQKSNSSGQEQAETVTDPNVQTRIMNSDIVDADITNSNGIDSKSGASLSANSVQDTSSSGERVETEMKLVDDYAQPGDRTETQSSANEGQQQLANLSSDKGSQSSNELSTVDSNPITTDVVDTQSQEVHDQPAEHENTASTSTVGPASPVESVDTPVGADQSSGTGSGPVSGAATL